MVRNKNSIGIFNEIKNKEINNKTEISRRYLIIFISKRILLSNNDRNIFSTNKTNKKLNNNELYIFSSNNSKIKSRNKYFFIIIFLLTFLPSCFSKNMEKLDSSSEITLTIKGTGDQYILNSITVTSYNYIDELPDEIYVNGVYASSKTNKVYGLTKEENNITLKWNTPLTDCSNMFRSINSIIKVDLSKFDSSKVTTMYCMFIDCINLKTINVSNLVTSSVTNMRSMFHSCSSLISLDLSNFDTSSVLYTYHMFMDCSSLVFINLFSFKETKLEWTDGMFLNTPNNLIFCINEEQSSLIKNELSSLSTNNDCSNTCFIKHLNIYIDANKKCHIDCNKNDNIYKYNGECFESCPKGTYFSAADDHLCVDNCDLYNFEKTSCISEVPSGFYINNSQLNTIDKCHPDCKTCNNKATSNNSNCLTCPNSKYFSLGNCTSSCINGYLNDKICKCPYNKKCKECPKERLTNDLCISCNNGYYPKYSDATNIGTYINCYKDPDGYYLDNNIYKPCYSTCKNCYGIGNKTNHNCQECNSEYVFLNETLYGKNCYEKCDYYYYFDINNNFFCTKDFSCPSNYKILIEEKKKCIDNCTNDEYFRYEYNNKCYDSCPEGTHNSNENNFLCIKNLECEKYYNYDKTLCINEIPMGYFLNDSILKTIDKCHPSCETCNKKEINNNSNCLSCPDSKFFSLGNCTSSCINGYMINSLNKKICKCPYNKKCKECPIERLNNDLCISCNDDYYQKYNDNANIGKYINCYKDPDGYYLDNNIYKPCYSTCKKCYGDGNENNHNCIECKNDYLFLNESNNINNCFEKCNNYYYFDNNIYYCSSEKKCPSKYSKLIEEKNKCIEYCTKDENYKYEFNEKCYISCPLNTKISYVDNHLCVSLIICPKDEPYEASDRSCIKECNVTQFFSGQCKISNNDPSFKDAMKLNIEKEISEGNLQQLFKDYLEEEKDFSIILGDIVYTITTPKNQKKIIKNNVKNISTIDLGECENILRRHYHIDENESLIILKIDYYEEGLLIPIVEYEIYSKNEKLDLNYCKDIKININLPVVINEKEEFKYNPLSDYYNNICFTYTTENKTDISLYDRKKEFNEKNMSLCESNCNYNGYDNNIQIVSCECEIKIRLPLISEIVINKEKLLQKFLNVKSYMNLNVIKCWKLLLTKDGIIKNIGSYIILGIIFIYLILLFLFLIKGYKEIYKKIITIKDSIQKMNHNNYIQTTKITKPGKRNNKIKRKRNKSKTENITNINVNNMPPKKFNYLGIKRSPKILKIFKGNRNSPITKTSKSQINPLENNINSKNKSNISTCLLNKNKNLIIENKKPENKNKIIMYYNDYEINSLDYKSALIIDKRTYCEFYLSLLRIKHLLIFSFLTSNDYNSKIIKINLFLFSFVLYFTVNTLFFNDSTMNKIHEDGKFKFIYQIPNIFYSSLICSAANLIVSSLSLTERNILAFKKMKVELKRNVLKLIQFIKIKIILFYLLTILILFFFWFYVSCFCVVYINTQIHLIKDSLISFGFTMIYPLGIYLIPGIFRIPALKAKKKDKECIYKISQISKFI